MASTTKIMTAILAIENSKQTDMVSVSKRASIVGGSNADLFFGEKIQMSNLLYALMLPSGNDAAIAIAEHISGSVENFAELMNEKARKIGANETLYISPHGLDRENYSTAYDLALITRYCLSNPIFSKIVGTKVKSLWREAYKKEAIYENTNEMLSIYSGADGVKTGYTGPAGRCVVTSATRNEWRVITVVLGSNSNNERYVDSSTLLDYAFDNYKKQTVIGSEIVGNELKNLNAIFEDGFINVKVLRGVEDSVGIKIKNLVKVYLDKNEVEKVKYEIKVPDYLESPVMPGAVVGSVKAYLNGCLIGETALVTDRGVQIATLGHILNKFLEKWFMVVERNCI